MTFITVVKMRTELDVDIWEPHNDAPVLRTKCSARTPGPWTRLRMRVSSAGTSPGLQGQGSQAPRAAPRPHRPGLQPAAVISRLGASHLPAWASGPCPGGLLLRGLTAVLGRAPPWRVCCVSSCSAPPWAASCGQRGAVSGPHPADCRWPQGRGGEDLGDALELPEWRVGARPLCKLGLRCWLWFQPGGLRARCVSPWVGSQSRIRAQGNVDRKRGGETERNRGGGEDRNPGRGSSRQRQGGAPRLGEQRGHRQRQGGDPLSGGTEGSQAERGFQGREETRASASPSGWLCPGRGCLT